MNQIMNVCILQRFGHLCDQLRRFVKRKGCAGHLIFEVRAVHEPRDDVAQTVVGAAHVVDRHNARVIQAGDQLRF